MAKSIVVTYVGSDVAAWAGRIFERIKRDFGRISITLRSPDEPTSGPVARTYQPNEALLVVVGQAFKGEGLRHTSVEREITAAISGHALVIPLLVDGTRMPAAHELPESLEAFTKRNAVALTHANFRAETQALVKTLKSASSRRAPATASGPPPETIVYRGMNVLGRSALLGLAFGVAPMALGFAVTRVNAQSQSVFDPIALLACTLGLIASLGYPLYARGERSLLPLLACLTSYWFALIGVIVFFSKWIAPPAQAAGAVLLFVLFLGPLVIYPALYFRRNFTDAGRQASLNAPYSRPVRLVWIGASLLAFPAVAASFAVQPRYMAMLLPPPLVDVAVETQSRFFTVRVQTPGHIGRFSNEALAVLEDAERELSRVGTAVSAASLKRWYEKAQPRPMPTYDFVRAHQAAFFHRFAADERDPRNPHIVTLRFDSAAKAEMSTTALQSALAALRKRHRGVQFTFDNRLQTCPGAPGSQLEIAVLARRATGLTAADIVALSTFTTSTILDAQGVNYLVSILVAKRPASDLQRIGNILDRVSGKLDILERDVRNTLQAVRDQPLVGNLLLSSQTSSTLVLVTLADNIRDRPRDQTLAQFQRLAAQHLGASGLETLVAYCAEQAISAS